jgi:hypothetical protein
MAFQPLRGGQSCGIRLHYGSADDFDDLGDNGISEGFKSV